MSTERSGWEPLLVGTRAALARDAIDAIGRELVAADSDAGILPGDIAAFYQYSSATTGAPLAAERAAEYLDRTVEGSAELSSLALHGGILGAAWSLEHLTAVETATSQLDAGVVNPVAIAAGVDGDPCDEVDEVLAEALAVESWTGPFDLVSGLVGYGVYCLERVERPGARSCLSRVLGHLERLAIWDDCGLTWHTPARLVPSYKRETYPDGWRDLGMAHGVPGVIAFLAYAHQTGVDDERVEPLLRGALDWLVGQQRRPDRVTSFGNVQGDEQDSRGAWCYGDPGVAVSVLWAARALNDDDLGDYAVAIASRSADRARGDIPIFDAGLCHGAIGLAHLYNRIYQATRNGAFADAAVVWYEKALQMRQPGKGLAGFETWDYSTSGELTRRADASFLTGSAGIGLGLLAAVGEVVPDWDRIMLTAVPPL